MYIGHLALAYSAKKTIFKKSNLFFLAAAGMGPDLIDKPLYYITGASGRGVAHTLVFFVMLTALLLFLSQKRILDPRVAYVGLIMWFSHLATDFLQPDVLFWPLGASADFYVNTKTLWQKVYDFYVAHNNPPSFYCEVFFDAAALFLFARTGLQKRPVAASTRN